MINDYRMSLLIHPKLGSACFCDICDKVLYYNPYIHADILDELKKKYDIDENFAEAKLISHDRYHITSTIKIGTNQYTEHYDCCLGCTPKLIERIQKKAKIDDSSIYYPYTIDIEFIPRHCCAEEEEEK